MGQRGVDCAMVAEWPALRFCESAVCRKRRGCVEDCRLTPRRQVDVTDPPFVAPFPFCLTCPPSSLSVHPPNPDIVLVYIPPSTPRSAHPIPRATSGNNQTHCQFALWPPLHPRPPLPIRRRRLLSPLRSPRRTPHPPQSHPRLKPARQNPQHQSRSRLRLGRQRRRPTSRLMPLQMTRMIQRYVPSSIDAAVRFSAH